MGLRVVFMGTPDFAVPTLEELVRRGHEIVAVYSQPPRPAGRGMEERRSPVHEKALEFGFSVHTPESLKSDADQVQFAAHRADVAVVVAYGLLLPQPILDAPRYGCFNGHASLLPRWRGAAPIQRAIMAGDKETGVMVMQMELGLDTGPVASCCCVKISPEMTAGELHDELMIAGAKLMGETLEMLEQGALELAAQSGDGVLYASKIDKAESRIDWANPASDVHNHIRGLSPFPGAWCEMVISGKPVRVKILKSRLALVSAQPGQLIGGGLVVGCAENAVEILQLQRSGKKAMMAEEFLRGYPAETISEIR